MPVESADDRAAFLNPNEFGEPLYWPADAAVPIYGLPDTGTVHIEGEGTPGVLSSHCSVLCQAVDVPGDGEQGDEVLFRSATYAVRSIDPDGTGMTYVRLERVRDDG